MLSVALKPAPDGQLQLHATTVSIEGKALTIAGPSGSGKSGLALRFMALGASLVSDDITWLNDEGGALIATSPVTLTGRIEARGIGILAVPPAGPTPVSAILDLGAVEHDRIPEPRCVDILGHPVALLHKVETPYLAEAVLAYMRGRRVD